MPIIVPIEDNKVGLATATDAKFRAPDYSGSGLEALGAGLVQLGDGGRQLAGGIEERRRRAAEAIAATKLDSDHQRYIDDAAVKKAYVDYSDLTHEALHGDNGLFKQPGAEAHAAFPDVVAKLADNHDKVLSKLDPVQRGAIAPVLGARLRSDVETAADRVRAQARAEQEWQVEKLKQATLRDAVASLTDPERHDHHMAAGEIATIKQGRIKKLSDKEIGRQVADFKSAVHAATIDTLTETDPVHAAGWYARYGDKLNDVDKQRIEAKLGPALADARAVADVDAAGAGDASIAPTNPHTGDDATLLLKMQGITPMMDQTALPMLMQRYGNDPAKAWAAFEAGPDTVDRLIEQRGDDWYAGLGDDSRRFVGGNMRMLDTARSLRDPTINPRAIVGETDAQSREDPGISAPRREPDWRIAPSAVANLGSVAPASPIAVNGTLQPVAYWQPDFDRDAMADGTGIVESDLPPGAVGPVPAQHQAQTQVTMAPAKSTGKSQRVIPQATINRNRAQAEIDIQNPYFRALMTLIGRYEGSDNPDFGNGYYTINGHLKKGDGLKDLSVFPADVGNKAVGRYQIQRDGLFSYAAPSLGITSFTPHDQDLMAAYVIRRRGMYDALLAGNFPDAAVRISKIWASFPTQAKARGVHGQAHLDYDTFLNDFKAELVRNQWLDQPNANPFLRKIPMGRLGPYDPNQL